MNSILDDFKLAFKTGNILNQLIVINVVVFVVLGVTGVFFTVAGYGSLFQSISNYLMLPANPSQLIYQPWTLITYFFYHEGVFHILFNMLFLYWFGRIIAEYIGQNKVLGLYVWGGIFGGALYLLIYNLLPFYAPAIEGTYLLGASGGVIAIVVGAATFMPNFTVPLISCADNSPIIKIKQLANTSTLANFCILNKCFIINETLFRYRTYNNQVRTDMLTSLPADRSFYGQYWLLHF